MCLKVGFRRNRRFKGTVLGPETLRWSANLDVFVGFAMAKLRFPRGSFSNSAGCKERPRKSSPVQAKAFLHWLQQLKTYCCKFWKSSGPSRRSSRFWRLFSQRSTNFFARSQGLGFSDGLLCDIISRPLAVTRGLVSHSSGFQPKLSAGVGAEKIASPKK